MRRVETTLALGHAERRESLDRRGEALDHVPAQILQPEPVAEQPPSRCRNDDAARLGQVLQPLGEIGRVADYSLLPRGVLPHDIAGDDDAGRDSDRTESFSPARVCRQWTASAISSAAWTAR